MKKYAHRSYLALVIGMVFTACASTELQTSWRAPDFAATEVKEVLVIGVGMKPDNRKLLEDSFVKAFSKKGAVATPSYVWIPDETLVDESALKTLLTEKGFQTVLIGKLIGRESMEHNAPAEGKTAASPGKFYDYGSNGGYSDYYRSGAHHMTAGTSSYTVDHAIVQTKLYTVYGEKLLWAGNSRTNLGDRSRLEALIRDYARRAVNAIYDKD